MRNKHTDKENVRAIVEANEVQHFSRDFFVKKGSKGGSKRWENRTLEERLAHGRMMVEARQKLSTSKDLQTNPPSSKIEE